MEEKDKSTSLNTNIIKPKTDTLNYGFKTLSNGLKVLLISDPDTYYSSAALGVNIGSLVDKKDEQGLSHFCEHLLSMGSKKYPSENEYGEYLSKNGGSSNAYTEEDKTIFFFDVSNEAFEGALDIFAHMFIDPTFNEGSVERELKAIDNEFSNRLNNDGRRMLQLKSSEMKKESPFNHFSGGNLKSLSFPDIRDKLLVYYKKYYSSDIMTLCIYNNKSLEEQLKIIEDLFSLIPRIEGFQMPKYDLVKPYDETNLKYIYKIVPVKEVNILQLEWYLPYIEEYKVEIGSYLANIFGHEGPNTLTSSLNRDNLCSELLAGPNEICKTCITLSISVSLTKKGFENYKEVILRILKYIKAIQNKKVNKRFYDEIKIVKEMRFNYADKLEPISVTESFCSNLMDFPPEKVYSGEVLLGEYNESLIKKYLDMLTLDNLNIYMQSKSFEKECILTEQYFGTKYCKEKFNITEEDINSYKCEHIFDYPPENNFIPTKFDILPPPEKISKYPEKIIDHKNMEIWYLQDTIFKKPKVYLVAEFLTPKNLCDFSDIKAYLSATLLDKVIESELGEFLYMAKKGSVNVTFSFGYNKAYIIYTGFNDSMKKGLEEIFMKIKNLDINTERCKETLELTQKDLLRRAKNIFLNSSYKVNLIYLGNLLKESNVINTDVINYYNEGKSITIEDLIIYKNAIFKNSKIKWLVQGNVTKEEVLELVEESNKILEIDINKEKTGKFAITRPISIKKNYNYIFKSKSPNPKEKSSSLISVYQTGLLNKIDIIYLYLISSYLEDKFYDQLRTKEALGYIVLLGPLNTFGYCGIQNIVESNSKTPEFCAERVRNFYKEIYQKIKDITEEEFQMFAKDLYNTLDKKDDNLYEVFMRNWEKIRENTYEFDKIEKSKENLKKCNKEGFIKFFEKYFIDEVAILDCEYLCDAHYEQNEKDLKESKISEEGHIKKRIICDSIGDFQACNELGVVYNNPVFMSNMTNNN